jgi:hypothetical protein
VTNINVKTKHAENMPFKMYLASFRRVKMLHVCALLHKSEKNACKKSGKTKSQVEKAHLDIIG